MTATATTRIAAPIAKPELNGYHGTCGGAFGVADGSGQGPDLAFSSSHSQSPLESYMPLPPTTLLAQKSSVRGLPQEDGEIRDTSTTIMNLNSKPVPRAPPIISGTEPPTSAVLLSSQPPLHTQSPPHPAVTPSPLSGRGTQPGQGRRCIAGCSILTSDFALRLHARSVSRST